VDFVIEAGQRLILVEAKYKQLKQEKVPASLRSFIEKYNPENTYVVNLNLKKILIVRKTTLFFCRFTSFSAQAPLYKV